MTNRRGIGRRALLTGTGAATLALQMRQAGAQDMAREAPELAKLVAGGKLPRLVDRLPAKPLVVSPTKRRGVMAVHCAARCVARRTKTAYCG